MKPRYPHLIGAMKMEGAPGMGLCVHRAAGMVLDTPGAELVFGVFEPVDPATAAPGESTEPFIHAWVEWRGMVYAPTLIEKTGGLHPMERDGYYAVNGARDIHRLPRPALLKVAKAIGLSRHLLKQVPTKGFASVGQTLLDAAGMSYRATHNGALLPLEANPQAMEPSHDPNTAD